MSWKIVRTAHLSLGFRSSAGWLAYGALVVALATPRIGCGADAERDSWQVSVIPYVWTISLDGSIELFGEFEREQRRGPIRIDATTRQPVVSARFGAGLTERIGLLVLADVGGFGSGSASRFMWSATPVVDLQPGSRWALIKAGYKVLDFDRDRIDLRQQGPVLGVSYAS